MTSPSNLGTRPSLGALGVLWAQVEDALLENGGEITPEVETALQSLEVMEGDKVDGYVSLAKALTGRAAACKAELQVIAEPLERTRKAAERAVENLKARMLAHLELRKKDRLQGSIYRARLQANSACPALELAMPITALPEAYRITTHALNTGALEALIPAGASKDQPQVITAGMVWDTKTEEDAAIPVAVRPARGKHVRFE